MIENERIKCFVSAQLSVERDVERRRQYLLTALRENEIEPILFEYSLEPGTRWSYLTVQQMIERVDFLLADLSTIRPNVLYEIGLADGMNKPVLLLIHHLSQEKVFPSDLNGRSFHLYKEPEDLSVTIRSWMMSYLPQFREGTR